MVDFQYVKGSTFPLLPPPFTHGLDPPHGLGLKVSLAMALAVPFTALAFASFDVPLLGTRATLGQAARPA